DIPQVNRIPAAIFFGVVPGGQKVGDTASLAGVLARHLECRPSASYVAIHFVHRGLKDVSFLQHRRNLRRWKPQLLKSKLTEFINDPQVAFSLLYVCSQNSENIHKKQILKQFILFRRRPEWRDGWAGVPRMPSP